MRRTPAPFENLTVRRRVDADGAYRRDECGAFRGLALAVLVAVGLVVVWRVLSA